MKNYKLLNNLFGWLSFLIAAITYTMTIEPTASFWDCGEFISTSYKLLVGHPPGAPFFMIIGRLFSLFAGDPTKVPVMINIMSALCSAFTIMFLFWTITHLAKKIYYKEGKEEWRSWAIVGAGFVGALAYTFSDTFWFSAVEGEVYAMSSLFTAMVFWAILKWENIADEKYANRWLILIAYLMGLSIGVHLLNLLAIPAIVLVYYYRKFEVNRKGLLKALGISLVLLLGILYGIIPYIVKIASWFELLFVNGMGAPYNTGVAIYVILLFGGLVYGIWYTQKKQKVILNTILLGITVIILGYSSFAMIVIRSSADPTMDQNSPDDVFSLQSYLNREQYGDRPLFIGQYYNSPVDREATTNKEGAPIRIRKDGKYETVSHKTEYVFNSKTTTIFPRMYSREQRHIDQYKAWSGFTTGKKVQVKGDDGKMKTITLPTFWNNITFFLNYQVNYMYFRYFMWNFSGRQNDMQGNGEVNKGNWISGIPMIDNMRLGDQSKLPELYKNNRARNRYFMLPFILGILGMLFQFNVDKFTKKKKKNKEEDDTKDKKVTIEKQSKEDIVGKQGFWIVLALFFLTGLAIVIYLNQTPLQPRERDYAYAGSFYAFAIWIGLGVLAVVEGIRRFLPGKAAAISAGLICLVCVPTIMAQQNWDDHDRSHRYVCKDLAYDYLNTCDKDAIIFTNGDNDTFPLWYAQEVEGIRTDVRVCNLSYLQTDWYIDQMKRKAYESDPMPFSLNHDQYVTGSRDVVHVLDMIKDKRVDLKEGIKFLASDNPKTKQIKGYEGYFDYLPTRKFFLPVDSLKAIQTGIVNKEDSNKIVKQINIDLDGSMIMKNEMMILDLISNNDWNRPIYFAVTVGRDNYMNLEDYFQLEGFAYKFVPIKSNSNSGQIGRVDADKMYEKFMNTFKWGGFDDPRVYLDENHQRMAMNIRNNMSRLANALIDQGEKDKAVNILDMAFTKLPVSQVPHNYFSLFLAEGYFKTNEKVKGEKILADFGKQTFEEMDYFTSLPTSKFTTIGSDYNMDVSLYTEIIKMASQYDCDSAREELCKQLTKLPMGTLPDDLISIYLAEGYYLQGNSQYAEQILSSMLKRSNQILDGFSKLPQNEKQKYSYNYNQAMLFKMEINRIYNQYSKKDQADSTETLQNVINN